MNKYLIGLLLTILVVALLLNMPVSGAVQEGITTPTLALMISIVKSDKSNSEKVDAINKLGITESKYTKVLTSSKSNKKKIEDLKAVLKKDKVKI